MKLLSATALLVASASPAFAGIDPVSISVEAWIFGSLVAAGVPTVTSLVLAPVLLTAAAVGALYGIGQLLKPNIPGAAGDSSKTVDPGAARNTFESSDAPELCAVGRVRLGGLKIYGNATGNRLHRITLHCRGEIDAYETFYLARREVIIAGNGAVTSYPWPDAPGSSNCYLETARGTGDETAWPSIVSDFPGVWTSDHRVRGIAQTHSLFISPGFSNPRYLKLFQGGPPDVEVVVRADKTVYDPRIDAEQWSENGVLNVLHIALSFPELTVDDFDLAFIGDEASRADVLVASKAGSVKRAVCWGVYSSETPRGDNLAKALDSIGAWLIERDAAGKLGIQLIDDAPTADVTIALEDIIKWDWKSGPDGVERPNICRVKYYSPERNYEMAEIDLTGIAWARIDDEVDRYGPKYYDVELPFCPNAGQAQRIARRMFGMARADTGIARTNMAGLAARGQRLVNIEFPDDMGTFLCAIQPIRVSDDEAPVEIAFTVWPTLTPWDTATDEADAPEQIPDIAYGTPLTQPATPDAATVVTFPDSSRQTRVHYGITAGEVTVVEAVFRVITNGLPALWQTMNDYRTDDYMAGGGYTMAYVDTDLTGQHVDFRLRTDDDDGNSSFWSGSLAATVGVDNSAPGACTFSRAVNLNDQTLAVSVFLPASLNVADVALTGADAPTVTNSQRRPGAQIGWVTAGFGNFTATAKSSNGTAGPTATLRSNANTGASGFVAASYVVGSNQVVIDWKADPTATTAVCGGGAGGTAPGGSGLTGQWVHSNPSPGVQTYTLEAFDAGGISLGVVSVNLTI